MTNISTTLGAVGSLVSDAESFRAKISWFNVVSTNNGDPLVFTASEIKFVNLDGTFTDIHGSGFAQAGDTLSGTVTQISHLSADGTTVLHNPNLNGLNVSLTNTAAALGDAGQQLFDLVGAGDNTLTGLQAQVGTTNSPTPISIAPPAMTRSSVKPPAATDPTSEWWNTSKRHRQCRSTWCQALSQAGRATTR